MSRRIDFESSTATDFTLSICVITKGDPSFLLDIPGFISYEPKFIAVSIEGSAEVLRLLSPLAPDFEARLAAIRRLSRLGIKTSIRLDPVLTHVWKTLYVPAWLDQLDTLAARFAGAGAKHIVSSTGRLDKRRPTGPGGARRESWWERILGIIEHQSHRGQRVRAGALRPGGNQPRIPA